MMTIKRIAALLLLTVMLLMQGLALGEGTKDYILDRANLLTISEEEQLLANIENFRKVTGSDFVLLTSSEKHEGTGQQVADNIFLRGGYGVGENLDGVLYYIDMYDRYQYISTSGKMIDYINDERIDAALDAVSPYLSSGDYLKAVSKMLSTLSGYYQKGIVQGQHQYDAQTGQTLTGKHKALTTTEILIALGAGIVVFFVVSGSVKGVYHLKGNTYEYDYRANGQLNLTLKEDTFTHTTTSRVPKPKFENKGGGFHGGGGGGHSHGSAVHSTGGHSFGGGGKHF